MLGNRGIRSTGGASLNRQFTVQSGGRCNSLLVAAGVYRRAEQLRSSVVWAGGLARVSACRAMAYLAGLEPATS